MKRNRFGMKRAMAVLLCFMLVLGSAGTYAYAGEQLQAGAEEANDTGALVPAAETSAEEAAAGEDDLGEDVSEEAASGEDASEEAAAEEDVSEEDDLGEELSEEPASGEGATEKDGTSGEEELSEEGQNTDEGSGDPSSGEAASEETGTLIEEPLSDDETTATDNAAALDDPVLIGVTYMKRSWDGTKVVSTEYSADNVSPVPTDGSMTSGWYYLGSDVTKDGRISFTGDVYLILGDGFTLDVRGLYVPAGSTLTIYSRSDGENAGKIYSHPGQSQGGAAIGGYSEHDNGNIVIHGGIIRAKGYDHCAGIGSNDGRSGGAITIYGGDVTAIGGSDGAAIGGGRNCSGGTINIYGGTVNANEDNDSNCSENGAGIGGGDCGDGGDITICGGTITAYSRDGAGIGGGDDGAAGNITITGGTITVNKVNQGQGARIGGGCDSNGGTVTITGGTITANGGSGAGIGNGKGGSNVAITLGYTAATRDTISITASSYSGAVTLDKPFKNNVGYYDAGIAYNLSSMSGSALTAWRGESEGLEFLDPYKGKQSHKEAYSLLTEETRLIKDGWYYVSGEVTVSERITAQGEVNLVLMDGAKLHAEKGISVTRGNSLTIWAQSADPDKEGRLLVDKMSQKGDDDNGSAGIGGDISNAYAGTIIIHGGNLDVTGGWNSAGIGGSMNNHRGYYAQMIRVDGGTIKARGGKEEKWSGDDFPSDFKSGGLGSAYNTFTWTPVVIGYGEYTGDTISIDSTYCSDVTFEQPFQTSEATVLRGTYKGVTATWATSFEGKEITLWDGKYTTWAMVQKGFNGGHDVRRGDAPKNLIKLDADITAQDGESALALTGYNIAFLDLNGHTLSRGLGSSAKSDGYVIKTEQTTVDMGSVYATGYAELTIMDSSDEQTGIITGGNNTGNAGGIYNDGTLKLQSGHIQGNRAGGNGGGIYNNNGFVFISGGSIEKNHAQGRGGGIYLSNKQIYNRDQSVFELNGGRIVENTAQVGGGGIDINNSYEHAIYAVSGATVVENNSIGTSGGTLNNISLQAGSKLTVYHALADDARLFVTRADGDGTGVITNGFGASNSGKTPDSFFFPDNPAYVVPKTSDEARIETPGSVEEYIHDVHYIRRSWDGTSVIAEDASEGLVRAVPDDGKMTQGWYYLNSNVSVKSRVTLQANTWLILGDGKTLDVKGLYIPEGSTLTIYGQSDGENAGKINSNPSGGAGIGGYSGHSNGNIVIHGGTIRAKGADHCAGIGKNDDLPGGVISIYGGDITAIGGSDGAAIGGGRYCSGGTINIYGGTVNANEDNDSNCSENGAGIGGGDQATGGDIKIYGGTITVYSRDGAGIGGGDDGGGGTITINGGTITANKVNQGQGARIGGGCDADGGTVTINGGTITTNGGSGAGIGGGKGCTGGQVHINGGIINSSGSYGIGNGEDGSGVVITLGYTADTRDTISITASSYKGTVTLDRIFTNGSQNLQPGEVTDLSLLNGHTLTAVTPVVKVKGVTGSFNDRIKLNYYFDIPETLRADQSAYVTITNESTGKTIKLPVKDAEDQENKGYKFSISLAAKEASDTITAKVFDGDGSAVTIIGERSGDDYTGTGVQYTLMQYFDWLEREGSDDNEKAVGAAAKDYCAAAQIYFKYHADGLKVSSAVDAVTADTLSSYISVREGELPEGVSIQGISAMLESDNTFRLYFGFEDVAPTGFTYAIDGNSVSLKQRPDGMYYLALDSGVYSNSLHDTHTYTVSDGTNTYEITASVLTYARSCVNKKGTTEDIKNTRDLGKALYLYNRAAVTAFGE